MNTLKKGDKVTVLFVCKNNSIRSQMAEAILNSFYSETHTSFSGGLEPKNINKNTIKVLKEIKINISSKKPKNIEIFKNTEFDHVITVCEDEKCPYFLNGKNYIYKKFKDPEYSPKSEHLNSFREIRDEIKNWIIRIVEEGVI
ncbi:MAG: arsenate reductase ArsC [Methanobacteriaceae archaeon]|jgi:arsenate reductase|nr:arsenate reductase ArsC [Candidatus Methanorudis spinitermitis]